MASQTQTQQGVEHGEARHRRRAKERPDALMNQFVNVSETNSSTQQNNTKSNSVPVNAQANSTLQETAEAFSRMDKAIFMYLARVCTKFDHKEFNLQAFALSHKFPTVSVWGEWIEGMIQEFNRACIYGAEDPDAYLRALVSRDTWAEAEAIFSQSAEPFWQDRQSEPYIIARNLVDDLCAYGRRQQVLFTDLLPRLVELNLFDAKMQAVLRRRWTYIDMIFDRWFRGERKEGCEVPDWQEISQLIKSSTAKDEDALPARLNQVSSALWLSLLVFLTTIPTTALGWQYSPHRPGTTQDADFWFLIQSLSMTMLSFAVLAIPVWRTRTFSAKARFWVWGLLIAASLCMALSPVVYVYGPTEWSQCMSIISGIFQVFLTLQIALVADSAGKGGSKSVKKDK